MRVRDRGLSDAAMDNPVSSINVKCQSITNNVANGLTRLIHGPSIHGHLDYSL